MPRTLALLGQYEGTIYHVMNRGDRKEDIFVDDSDRQRFLEPLEEACQKMKALGKAIGKVPSICHDLPPQSPVDGLMGPSFLKWFDVDLHFRCRG